MRGTLVGLVGDGEFPAVANGHEAEGDTDEAAEGGGGGGGVAGDMDRRAGEGGDGVEFGGEDGGDFGDEEVAGDAAADAGEDTHEDCADRFEVESQGLAGAGDGAEAETEGVEELDGALHFVDEGVPVKGHDAGEEGKGEVAPVLDGGGRDGADEDVAEDTAGGGGGEGECQHAEEVEALLDAGDGAAKGEDEGSDQVDQTHGLADDGVLVDRHRSYDSRRT